MFKELEGCFEHVELEPFAQARYFALPYRVAQQPRLAVVVGQRSEALGLLGGIQFIITIALNAQKVFPFLVAELVGYAFDSRVGYALFGVLQCGVCGGSELT